MSEHHAGSRSSIEEAGHPSPIGVRLLAAPVVAGLTFVAVLDGIGGQLQTRYRASRTRPRNRIPPVAFLFIAVGIVLTVLCIYAVVQNDAGGNGWMYGP